VLVSSPRGVVASWRSLGDGHSKALGRPDRPRLEIGKAGRQVGFFRSAITKCSVEVGYVFDGKSYIDPCNRRGPLGRARNVRALRDSLVGIHHEWEGTIGMSDHPDAADSRKTGTPSDNDQSEDSDVDVKAGTPHAEPNPKGGVPTGEEKASANREVDPPA
jgi:hypothetical protein